LSEDLGVVDDAVNGHRFFPSGGNGSPHRGHVFSPLVAMSSPHGGGRDAAASSATRGCPANPQPARVQALRALDPSGHARSQGATKTGLMPGPRPDSPPNGEETQQNASVRHDPLIVEHTNPKLTMSVYAQLLELSDADYDAFGVGVDALLGAALGSSQPLVRADARQAQS
jgi:hypothetical protein